jgi:hypothetical protein
MRVSSAFPVPHNLPYEPKVLKSIMLHQELCIVQLSVLIFLSIVNRSIITHSIHSIITHKPHTPYP